MLPDWPNSSTPTGTTVRAEHAAEPGQVVARRVVDGDDRQRPLVRLEQRRQVVIVGRRSPAPRSRSAGLAPPAVQPVGARQVEHEGRRALLVERGRRRAAPRAPRAHTSGQDDGGRLLVRLAQPVAAGEDVGAQALDAEPFRAAANGAWSIGRVDRRRYGEPPAGRPARRAPSHSTSRAPGRRPARRTSGPAARARSTA